MSAMPSEQHEIRTPSDDESVVAGHPVVVRRHAGLAALIGASASAVAIAYLWRASQTMLALDWALCAVMATVATMYLATFVDSRTPLLVADELGVRIRLGREWRGLPWDAIDKVLVRPRRGMFRDGRIVFAPRSPGRALDGLEGKSKRQASLNEKMYGAALAVPLGITTRVSTGTDLTVAEGIQALTLGRAEVVEIAPDPEPVRAASSEPGEPVARNDSEESDGNRVDDDPPKAAVTTSDNSPEEEPRRRPFLGGLGTIVSRVGKGRRNDVDAESEPPPVPVPVPVPAPAMSAMAAPAPSAPSALRETRPALRAEVTRDAPATSGNAALAERLDDYDRGALPERRELRRPGSVDLVFEPSRVRPISTLGDPVEPLVIDDFVTEPAYDPVIGPELAAARTRVGLSVDELSERTRIRPHVIESIEVDDFTPCGGDFYARGHLRTLARVLGKDPAPLMAAFEERYATAPINARRVFEAELATGMTGSMRGTIGGPNWGLLVGVVLSLVLIWGVARLFAADPATLVQDPAPVLNGSAGVERAYPTAGAPAPVEKAIPVMLVAAHADSSVVVRNGDGRIVFSGELVLGEKKRLDVAPPVRVRAADAGAVEVTVQRKDKGVVGELGEPGRRTFR